MASKNVRCWAQINSCLQHFTIHHPLIVGGTQSVSGVDVSLAETLEFEHFEVEASHGAGTRDSRFEIWRL